MGNLKLDSYLIWCLASVNEFTEGKSLKFNSTFERFRFVFISFEMGKYRFSFFWDMPRS